MRSTPRTMASVIFGFLLLLPLVATAAPIGYEVTFETRFRSFSTASSGTENCFFGLTGVPCEVFSLSFEVEDTLLAADGIIDISSAFPDVVAFTPPGSKTQIVLADVVGGEIVDLTIDFDSTQNTLGEITPGNPIIVASISDAFDATNGAFERTTNSSTLFGGSTGTTTRRGVFSLSRVPVPETGTFGLLLLLPGLLAARQFRSGRD